MADNIYQVGDLVPLQATFRDAAGALANTTVALTVRAPDGTITTPTPTNPSTGVYHYDLAASQPGLWWYTFKGTGTIQAAERRSLYVESDWITAQGPLSSRALVTLEEAREYVLSNVLDNTQDHKLVRRINAFSEAVWQFTRREWTTSVAVTRTFQYPGYGMLSLAPYDLRAATAIVLETDYPTAFQTTLVAGSPTVLADYRLRPIGGTPEGTYRWVDFSYYGYLTPNPLWISDLYDGYGYGYANRRRNHGFGVTVTGDWGIPTVPDDVKEAVLIAIDNATRNPEGAAARTFGDLTIVEPVDASVEGALWRALPGESRALLAPYRDDVGAVVG
jgi:hypothetical protein